MPGPALATRGRPQPSSAATTTGRVGCVTATSPAMSTSTWSRRIQHSKGPAQHVDTAHAVPCLCGTQRPCADIDHTTKEHNRNSQQAAFSPAPQGDSMPSSNQAMMQQQHNGGIVHVASLDDMNPSTTTDDESDEEEGAEQEDTVLDQNSHCKSKHADSTSSSCSIAPSYVNENWTGDKRVDDVEVHAVLRSVPEVEVHARCRSHNDVRAHLGDRAYRKLTRLLRPVFSVSRKALIVTLFMDWQKRTSNRNMHQLYRRKQAFRQMRARRRGTDLAALARKHNVGVTELGMSLVGGLFSKYFCLTPHRLDPTAKRDKHEVLEDDAFLRRMGHHRVRVSLVLRARQRLRAVEEAEAEDEEGTEGEETEDEEEEDSTQPPCSQHQHLQPSPSAKEPLPEVTEEEWMRMVEEDQVLRAIALEGALCMDGMRYYSRTDSDHRMFWFQQVVGHSKTDKISAFTYRDAQAKPRQATHAEQQLMRDLEAMGVPRESYLLEAEMKKANETNVATPDVKFHHSVSINGKTVRWIDVKSGLALPRTSCSRLLGDFARKLRRYIDLHGEGLVLMHHVPLSTGIEAWAASALGPERAHKVTFLSRVRVNESREDPKGRKASNARGRRESNGQSGCSRRWPEARGNSSSSRRNSNNSSSYRGRIPLLPTPAGPSSSPLAVGLLHNQLTVPADSSANSSTTASCCSTRGSSPDRSTYILQQQQHPWQWQHFERGQEQRSTSRTPASSVYRPPHARSHQPSPIPNAVDHTRTSLSQSKRAGSRHRRTRSSPPVPPLPEAAAVEAYVPPHRRTEGRR